MHLNLFGLHSKISPQSCQRTELCGKKMLFFSARIFFFQTGHLCVTRKNIWCTKSNCPFGGLEFFLVHGKNLMFHRGETPTSEPPPKQHLLEQVSCFFVAPPHIGSSHFWSDFLWTKTEGFVAKGCWKSLDSDHKAYQTMWISCWPIAKNQLMPMEPIQV